MENVKLLNIHERILLARPDALRFGEDYFLFDAALPSLSGLLRWILMASYFVSEERHVAPLT